MFPIRRPEAVGELVKASVDGKADDTTAPVPAHAALPAVHIKYFISKIITRFAVEQHEPVGADPEFTVA